MTTKMLIEFAEGKKLYVGGGAQTGLAEVGAAEKVVTATSEAFKSALGTIGELERFPIRLDRKAALHSCFVAFSRREPVSTSLENALVKILEESVGNLPSRPSTVELEFNAKLSGDCNLWIVSGEGEAEFKVKLAWEKTP